MRLAGEDDLHGTYWVVEKLVQALELQAEHEGGALVGGKAASEADGQRLRAEDLASRLNRCPLPPPLVLASQPTPHEINQPSLQNLMCLPQLAVHDMGDTRPHFRLAAASLPIRSQVAVVKIMHRRRHPGRGM